MLSLQPVKSVDQCCLLVCVFSTSGALVCAFVAHLVFDRAKSLCQFRPVAQLMVKAVAGDPNPTSLPLPSSKLVKVGTPLQLLPLGQLSKRVPF